MSPRSAAWVGWPKREEENLIPWLDAHRDLSWKAHSDASYEDYQVDRSIESLRGRKYEKVPYSEEAASHWRQSSQMFRQTKAARRRAALGGR